MAGWEGAESEAGIENGVIENGVAPKHLRFAGERRQERFENIHVRFVWINRGLAWMSI